jgi:hypothetical protein
MQKISDSTEKAIIRAYFEAKSRDEVARELSVGAGTVSDRWTWLEDLIGARGRALRSLSNELAASNLGLSDAAGGAEISSKLYQLGVKEKFRELIEICQASLKSGDALRTIIDSAIELSVARDRTEKDYGEMLQDYKKADDALPPLLERIAEAKKEEDAANRQRDEAVRAGNTTIKELSQYTSARDSLSKLGADMRDTPKLAAMLSNAKEQNFDARRMAVLISIFDRLGQRADQLEKDTGSLQTKKEKVESELEGVQNQVSQQKILLERLETLRKMGFDEKKFGVLVATLDMIAQKRRITEEEAIRQFFSDLRTDYDGMTGFRAKIRKLDTTTELAKKNAQITRTNLDDFKKACRKWRKRLIRLQSATMKENAELDTIVERVAKAHKIEAEFENLNGGLESFKLQIKTKEKRIIEKHARFNATLEAEKAEKVAKLNEIGVQERTLVKDVKREVDRISRELTGLTYPFVLFRVSTTSDDLGSLTSSDVLVSMLAAIKGLIRFLRVNRRKP